MTNEELLALAVKADLSDEYGTVNYEYGFKDEILAYGKLVADKRVEGMVVMTPEEFKSVWDKAQAEERDKNRSYIHELEIELEQTQDRLNELLVADYMKTRSDK